MTGASNLATILEARAAERGDAPGLFDENGRSWTFAQIDLLAGGVAEALTAAGVGAGDRIAFYLTNGPDVVFFLFGAWKIGAIPVTISSLYNASELADAVHKTSPRMLLVDARGAEAARAVGADTALPVLSIDASVEGVDTLDWGQEARVSGPAVADEAEACILFTGGTTGRPKAVSVTHGGTFGSLARLAQASSRSAEQGTAAPDAAPNLIALPLFHSGGQHALLFAFYVGRPAVVWERFGVERLAALMERFRFDNFFLLPTMVFDIVHSERELPFDDVKSVLVAGQAISWTLRREFEERYRTPILVNYGSTESGHIAGWTGRDMKAGLWKPGSAGRVYEGVELEVRADDGSVVADGGEGEIVVRSELTRGYVDDAEASAELIRDGWVHTGDVGHVDEDGVLWLSGRKRDMIKCGGFQVWPEEIEDVLREHPAVVDARVLGIPDDRLGEIPVAVIVRSPDAASRPDDDVRAELVAFSRERLAHFKTPRRVEFVDELERSEAGKVKRVAIAGLSGGDA